MSPKAPKQPQPIDWVFIFDHNLKKCFGRVDDREAWRTACYVYGNMKDAAREVGIKGVPYDAVPLRGITPEDARDRQLRYLERKRLEEAGLFIPYHKRKKLKEGVAARKSKASPSTAKKPRPRRKAARPRSK